MKIVIDIPKEQYTTLNAKTQDDIVDVIDHGALIKAIKNGTPLPKGHGRLVDMDWIDDECPDYRTDDDGSFCYKWADIKKAPTIIEADKGGEAE